MIKWRKVLARKGLFFFGLLFTLLLPLQSYGAARFAGTIVSIDSSSGIYMLKLQDGTIVKIKLKENASIQRVSGKSFSQGEHAVFSIVSPLNDDPLIADAIMDEISAKKTAPAAYTIPSNTRVGGFATTGGPSATGGTNPNVLASVAQSGGNFYTPNVINAPFTASPAPANSPFTAQVLTNNSNIGQNANNTVNQMNGQNSQNAIPSPLNNPFTGQSVTSGTSIQPPQVNQGSIISGDNNFQAQADCLIMQDPLKDPLTGRSDFCDPSRMVDSHNDEDDEDAVSLVGEQNIELDPCQINAMILDINPSCNVVFYSILGTQELGSCIVTPQTQILDGNNRKILSINMLPKRGVVVINGYRRGENSIQASSIILMQR